MKYTFTIEVRKAEWTGSQKSGYHAKPGRRSWLARVDGRGKGAFEFVALPKLPRGVRQGPVTVDLDPGIYRYDDRNGNAGAFCVTATGDRVDLTPERLALALRDVPGFVADQSTVPETVEGYGLHVGRLGKLCQVVGLDPRYKFRREWSVPFRSVFDGRDYLLPVGGIFEVREPEGICYWYVPTDGTEARRGTAGQVEAYFRRIEQTAP